MPNDDVLEMLDGTVIPIKHCFVCAERFPDVDSWGACPKCRDKYPSELLTVCRDQSQKCTIGLRNGLVIFAGGAGIQGDWVELWGIDPETNEQLGAPALPVKFNGELTVRLDEIIWIALGFVGESKERAKGSVPR